MLKNLILLFLFIFSATCFSQISFEKGYYIDNANQKKECLIKNMDWKSNPDNFEYKMTPDGQSENINIKAVKEFGIYMSSKYVRHTVKMDQSSEDLDKLTQDKTPLFIEETHFLKVLIDGNASLYSYEGRNLKRYFYTLDNSEIEPLVFKKFLTSENKVRTNNEFKQQLWNNLKCPSLKMKQMKNLQYKKNSLMKVFMDYNKCTSSDFINYEEKDNSDMFNITLRPRFNNSSLDIKSTITQSRDTDFGAKSGFVFGIDFEYILPFTNKKWSISIEPTYQNFKAERISRVDDVSGGELLAIVDYKSLELPISLRHYFFLNKDSKIYANLSYQLHVDFNSFIEFQRGDGSILNTFDVKSENNFAFGIGYKFMDKYSIEARYNIERNILQYPYWKSQYQTTSIILGYTIF